MDLNHPGPHAWEGDGAYLARIMAPKLDSLTAALSALVQVLTPPGKQK